MKVAVLVLGLSSPLAAQIHVPADQPSLQAAIDAAAAGQTIVVHGGPSDGVVVDKPLTIVFTGTGVWGIGCGVDPGCVACPDDNAFRLAGPGAGRVAIVGYRGLSQDCFFPAPAIEGGGFDELLLLDCAIRIESGKSGLGHGAHAIDVDVPFVVLSRTSIRARCSGSDHCAGFLFEDLSSAVRAPNASVLVLDSDVRGGDGGLLCCIQCACPALPDPAYGGSGGPGIVAREIHHAGSKIQGGRGAVFTSFACCDPYHPLGQPTACGKQQDGASSVAQAVHALPGALAGPSTVAAGSAYELEWDLPGPAFLFSSIGFSAPAPILAAPGFCALAKGSMSFLGPMTTGAPHTLAIPIPKEPLLFGVGFAFQAVDGTLGITRPAIGIVVP